jgi:hydrogenase/urease accessory protein HupE
MLLKTTLIKRLLLPVAVLLLAIAWFCGRLTDTTIVDLTSGFSHPLDGWDHLVTMLAVGIWAAQLRGKAIWLLPLTFVGVMSLGGISGAAKYLAVPSAEVLILLSCLVFSVLIIRKIRFDTKINVLIVAFFAFFHGYAHGQEISASASLISYTLGFMVATLLLHGAGILAAKIILLSITFFIALALNVIAPTESIQAVTAIYSHIAPSEIQQIETKFIEKPPLINWNRWLNLSPQLEPILSLLTLIKTYFSSCALLFIFSVSQFVCYVFYPKKRRDSASFLACYFKNSRYLSICSVFQLSKFNLLNPLFLGGYFRAPKIPKIIL